MSFFAAASGVAMVDLAEPKHFSPALFGELNETVKNDGDIWNIAVVDQRSLLGECIVSGLRPLDEKNMYSLYPNVGLFLQNHVKGSRTVVLLYRSEDSGAQGSASERDFAKIREADSSIRVVLISDQGDPNHVLQALQMGAHGFIPMSFPLRVFVEALRLVKAGGVFVPASSMQELANGAVTRTEQSHSALAGFSPKQISVARALRKGTPNKIIAYELNMCESTVKVHVRQIMKKLRAKNRTEIAYLTSQMFANET